MKAGTARVYDHQIPGGQYRYGACMVYVYVYDVWCMTFLHIFHYAIR